jgi:hypothetical protein
MQLHSPQEKCGAMKLFRGSVQLTPCDPSSWQEAKLATSLSSTVPPATCRTFRLHRRTGCSDAMHRNVQAHCRTVSSGHWREAVAACYWVACHFFALSAAGSTASRKGSFRSAANHGNQTMLLDSSYLKTKHKWRTCLGGFCRSMAASRRCRTM